LEYLGDAVLELLVSEELFKKFPNEPEGQLTVFRAALVNYQILAKVAERIGMQKFIYNANGIAVAGRITRPIDHPLAPQGVCVADALHVRSQSRYNNGQPVSTVRLQPMDGIILPSDHATFAAPAFSMAACRRPRSMFPLKGKVLVAFSASGV